MTITTNHPIALDSPDHTHAWGAARDNTRCPAFVKACERYFEERIRSKSFEIACKIKIAGIRVLDLGCAGGGLVEDFIEAGHDAYGIDGAEAASREAWLRHPGRFFHADLRHPFNLNANFAIVTAFEVLEHIPEQRLGCLLTSIDVHMRHNSLFIATISLVPDEVNGVQYHQTVRDADWWRGLLERHGFDLLDSGMFREEEWPRKEKTSLRVVARRMA